jgi:general secretion pathway protein H
VRVRCRGFSLLELLVVVVIIGILAGAVVLSMNVVGNDRVVEREVSRLRSLIELLREEALMQSRDFGVLFSETGYRFYVYDYQHSLWVEPTGDRLLTEHALPERLSFALTLEERELALERTFELEANEEPEPQIMISSSGEVTPFQAAVSRDLASGRFVLKAELDGSVEVTEDGYERRL